MAERPKFLVIQQQEFKAKAIAGFLGPKLAMEPVIFTTFREAMAALPELSAGGFEFIILKPDFWDDDAQVLVDRIRELQPGAKILAHGYESGLENVDLKIDVNSATALYATVLRVLSSDPTDQQAA